MTKISIQGRVEHKLIKEFQGNTTTILQFITKSEKKGFEVLRIKMIEENTLLKEGDMVSIPVAISAMNNNIFYAQNGKIEILKG